MKYTSIILVLVFLFACKTSEEKPELKNELLGMWDIYSATRNGRPTSTLKEGYMSFNEGKQLETNIMGSVTTSDYVLDDNNIISSDPFPFEFKINDISADSLQLSGRMKVFRMVFYMKRPGLDSLEMDAEIESAQVQ